IIKIPEVTDMTEFLPFEFRFKMMFNVLQTSHYLFHLFSVLNFSFEFGFNVMHALTVGFFLSVIFHSIIYTKSD
uniref:Uncharacterized protein n=1 Tax=Amphimedon queenslandica TaxID=400682 RepID=A0A1X7UQE9_AMPQE